ncbi:polysaccharide biosynthesis/export family protein [Roseibacillus ishigakijimensis]|uniref:SLBB domain-containing protein n=1 Tax=Roseibacillus ishigakijimensis TaxID=454146 RepID=A0A934VL86_9BACT|nr:SLBB domain-containing protein [Roseibacillus ishigakijimensis]MBK1832967.1 SLBB domain-containing protein [Roseibacillus ishigakijimensis]
MKTILVALVALLSLCQIASAQIQKNTKLKITVMGVPAGEQTRINAVYPVDSSGNIRMWEIGSIRAAGLSSTALAKQIESSYKSAQIYTSPTILIEQIGNVETELQQFVTVMGSVQRPGTVPYIKGMTLAQAIAAAGGPNTFGTTKRVSVYREGKKYSLSPRTNDKHKLERVYPSDTIEVDQVKAWESGGE